METSHFISITPFWPGKKFSQRQDYEDKTFSYFPCLYSLASFTALLRSFPPQWCILSLAYGFTLWRGRPAVSVPHSLRCVLAGLHGRVEAKTCLDSSSKSTLCEVLHYCNSFHYLINEWHTTCIYKSCYDSIVKRENNVFEMLSKLHI